MNVMNLLGAFIPHFMQRMMGQDRKGNPFARKGTPGRKSRTPYQYNAQPPKEMAAMMANQHAARLRRRQVQRATHHMQVKARRLARGLSYPRR